jgi:hypothetical protein
LILVTAIDFAQNAPSAEQRCQQIARLEADLGQLRLKYTELHPQMIRLREEIAAQRTELQKASPGYVCKSPIAGLFESQQRGDQRAGIIVTQPNVTQPNTLQPNGRSYACAPVEVAVERVTGQLKELMRLDRAGDTAQRDMQALTVSLATAELALAGERLIAASQGLHCSGTGDTSSVCDRIKRLHEDYARFAYVRQKKMELGYPEKQYDVQAVSLRLASLETTLAAEKVEAASQGIDCPATEPKPER